MQTNGFHSMQSLVNAWTKAQEKEEQNEKEFNEINSTYLQIQYSTACVCVA